MAKLTGFDRVAKTVETAAHKAMRTTVKDYVIKHALLNLDFQRDKTGQKMPEKAESTKKQYRRKGYDTEKFLVASGKSTQMMYEWLNGVLTVYPQGQTVLGYNVPKRTEWVQPTDALLQSVKDLISEEVRRALKS